MTGACQEVKIAKIEKKRLDTKTDRVGTDYEM